MNFRKINNITGWIILVIACATYTLTREATASLWVKLSGCGWAMTMRVRIGFILAAVLTYRLRIVLRARIGGSIRRLLYQRAVHHHSL